MNATEEVRELDAFDRWLAGEEAALEACVKRLPTASAEEVWRCIEHQSQVEDRWYHFLKVVV